MSKMRVHEYAKSVDKESKEIINLLKNNGIEVKNHMSTIDDAEIAILEKAFHPAKQEEKPKEIKTQEVKMQETRAEKTQEAKPQKKIISQVVKSSSGDNNRRNEDVRRPVSTVRNPQNSANGQRDGNRPFNREGGQRDGNRPFNREGGQRDGNRPFNREGGQRDGNRPFNKDGNDRPFNKDGQGRDNNRGRNDFSKDRRQDNKSEFVFETKPEARKPESRRPDNKNQKDYSMDEKENQKFANSRPGQFNKPKKVEEKNEEESIKTIILPDVLTIKDLADKMKVQPSALVKKLFLQGKIVTINQEIDFETAEEIALEFNCLCEHEEKIDVIAELLKEEEEPEEKLKKRPPVVCVMGHVDHGKTSLLDAIRSTNVTSRESGGITQHIGAYTVEINGEKITFLDTPGHEAFTAMRMRGAKSTDIAILVVAADDGVMPQTIEAINHAKAAGIEIIVAINKIDKPSANVERVKQELIEYDLVAEDWGGSTIFVPVSAHTKEGIDTLLEMILLVAEMRELKANPDRKARGLVIEAQLDKGRGPVATVLVQKGTLHVGDTVKFVP